MPKKGDLRLYTLIIILILLVISLIVFTFIFSYGEIGSKKVVNNIELSNMKVKPETFTTNENGSLIFTIRNLSTNRTNVRILFETHKNIIMYLGREALPKIGGNYTYSISLDSEQKIEMKFRIRAKLDVGDAERTYYIKAYIFVDNQYGDNLTAVFKVRK